MILASLKKLGQHAVLLVPVDIKIAKGPLTPDEFVAEDKEETEGGYVGVNANNDNGSSMIEVEGHNTHIPTTRDMDATVSIPNEKDLVRVKLEATLNLPYTARISITNNGRGRVKLWKEKTNEHLFLDGDHVDVPFADLPEELWVEGVKEGADEREIALSVDVLVGSQVAKGDEIKLTVTPVLKEHSTSPGGVPALVEFEPTGMLLNRVVVLNTKFNSPFGSSPGVLFKSKAICRSLVGKLQHIQIVNISNTVGALKTTANSQVVKSYDFSAPFTGQRLIDCVNNQDPIFYNELAVSSNDTINAEIRAVIPQDYFLVLEILLEL